jgi:hypothetical protein
MVSNRASADRRIRVISQGYNTWKVQVLFPEKTLSAAAVSQNLQDVKTELAGQFGVPNHLLEYSHLISKQTTRNGLLVQMQIVKHSPPSAPPTFHSLPAYAPDGTLFSDQILTADFFPYDEFERPISLDVVKARLKMEGYDLGCVDSDAVNNLVQEVQSTGCPILGAEIGRGKLPSTGTSSRLTYGVSSQQERLLSTAWMGLRPVQEGEFLVEASTAITGHQWGRNIYGRELEPRQGLQTTLEAGEGVYLMMRGSQMMARQDGLLVFTRVGRDKRDIDAHDLVPAKLIGRVLIPQIVRETEFANLELTQPAIIAGMVPRDAQISSNSALYIDGDVEAGARVYCNGSLRIAGYVRRAEVTSRKHLCIHGEVSESHLRAELTLAVDGIALNSSLQASDVFVMDIQGGSIEALRQPSFAPEKSSGALATSIRINLRRLLEKQQLSSRDALSDLQAALSHIVDIFGPDITLHASEGNTQHLLISWLRAQKARGIGNYTHKEVHELRVVLEMIPQIRAQLTDIGSEIREITSRLEKTAPT